METRVLIPEGLKLVVIDDEVSKARVSCKVKLEPNVEEEYEEKPSSSSGLFETNSEKGNSAILSPKESNSSTNSSLSSSSSDSSDNEIDSNYKSKSEKSENRIGSSTRPGVSRKRDREDDNDEAKADCTNHVKICTNRIIEKGTIFSPSEGDFQVAHLNGIPNMPKDDVRYIFGCFESFSQAPLSPLPSQSQSYISPASTTTPQAVTPPPCDDKSFTSGCKFVRLCNWVRFLRRSYPASGQPPRKLLKVCSDSEEESETATKSQNLKTESDHNVIARFVEGRPIFEVVEQLVPGTELRVHFDINSALVSQSILLKTPPEMGITTPLNVSPPAPSSSSSRMRSTSPALISGKKERDEGLRHRQLPISPYFRGINGAAGSTSAMFRDAQVESFYAWQNHKLENCTENSTMSYSTDGPLDLTRSFAGRQTPNEPLKVGTPFDSPDSHDDKSSSSSQTTSESGGDSSFSIRNVLKQEAKRPTKLFQPYSIDIGKSRRSSDTDRIISALTVQPASHHVPLVSQPSSESPLGIRSVTGMRPILRTRGRERSLLPCEVCGKAFDRPSLLKRHLRTHTGEKPHICDVCSKGFSTSSSLNTHRRIHSGEKPHQCPICGKRFTASSNLYYHRMTHNKEKPHKCMLCGKSFPTPGDLKSHQYVHSGSWPYNCPVCHRGFSKQTNLRNHLLLHTGMPGTSIASKNVEKTYFCQLCDKKFSQQCTLRAHMKTHEISEENNAGTTCGVCKRSYLVPELLHNGRCRDCLHSSKPDIYSNSPRISGGNTSPQITTSGASTPTAEKAKDVFPSGFDVQSLLSHRMLPLATQQALPTQIGHIGMAFPGFSVPGTLSTALGFPTSGFPIGANRTPSATEMFGNASGNTTTSRNPILDQIVEWNYRLARESAGIGGLGLNMMHQKVLETHSRVLAAAQLMNSHGFGINGAMQDFLGIRALSSSSSQHGFTSGVGESSGESKFGQR